MKRGKNLKGHNYGLCKKCGKIHIPSTDKAIKSAAQWHRGKPSWNKGLSKETDERLANLSKSVRLSYIRKPQLRIMRAQSNSKRNYKLIGKKISQVLKRKGLIPWNKGKKGLQTSWNKGLTKETNPIVMIVSQKNKGKKLSQDAKQKLSMRALGHPPSYPKLRFIEDLGHSIRSKWEEQICNYLKENEIKYQYEANRFMLKVQNKLMTYTPDLKFSDNLYAEIKGPFFDSQFVKLKSFLEQYPNIALIFIHGCGRAYCHLQELGNFKNFIPIAFTEYNEKLSIIVKSMAISEQKDIWPLLVKEIVFTDCGKDTQKGNGT